MATTFLQVKNNAFSTLSSGVDDVATVFPVSDITKYPGTFPFHASVEDEIIKVAGVSGSNLDPCTRAQEGTSAVGHSSGATIEVLITAQLLTDIYTAINALEALGGSYLLRDGSLPLTGDWDPGNNRVIGNFLHTEKVLSFAVGDVNYGFAIVGGFPTIYLDIAANDYIQYDRDAHTWTFVIGGLVCAVISASGLTEITPGTGVTIDGVLLKDGRVPGSALPFAIPISFGAEESYAP
jgi:uncharacterized protein (DUF1330 family)